MRKHYALFDLSCVQVLNAKRSARANKYENLVEESELLQATPEYAWIKRKDGTEDTVSFRQIEPKGILVSKPDAEKPNSEEQKIIYCLVLLKTYQINPKHLRYMFFHPEIYS